MGQKKYPSAIVRDFFLVYLGLARTTSVMAIAALFILYGLFQGIFRSVGKAFASDFVPERLRASGVGWYSTTVGLLQLVASVVAGLLWEPCQPCCGVLLRCGFCCCGEHRIADSDPRKAKPIRRLRLEHLSPPVL